MTYWTLFRKDFTEALRTNRIILLPLLFILLSLSNVILLKMLPRLLKTAGNMPKGTVIQLPVMTSHDAIGKVVSQFDDLGVLVLALVFMGLIASERASGFLTTLLVKPVSRWSYVLSKYTVSVLLTTLSYVMSMALCWYYINLWFSPHLAAREFLLGSLVYWVKLVLILAVILFFSSVTKSAVGAGGLAITVTILLSLLNTMGWFHNHFPSALSSFSTQWFAGQGPALLQPLLYAALLVIALVSLAVYFVSRRDV